MTSKEKRDAPTDEVFGDLVEQEKILENVKTFYKDLYVKCVINKDYEEIVAALRSRAIKKLTKM